MILFTNSYMPNMLHLLVFSFFFSKLSPKNLKYSVSGS